MTAARPFRWLLALVALIVPASLGSVRAATGDCRTATEDRERGAGQEGQSRVVFRHFV